MQHGDAVMRLYTPAECAPNARDSRLAPPLLLLCPRLPPPPLQTYTWMIVVHGIVAWLDAYGIGANDVANAFGTSVGSKTLTMWSAVVIAAIFEFLGAMLLGGAVTKTIAGGIAKTSVSIAGRHAAGQPARMRHHGSSAAATQLSSSRLPAHSPASLPVLLATLTPVHAPSPALAAPACS